MQQQYELGIRITANGQAAVGQVRQAAEGLKAYAQEAAAAAEKARKLNEEQKRSGAIYKTLNADISGLKAAIASLGIGLLVRDIAQAGLAQERWITGLRAATGSNERAAQELVYIRQEAERLGLEVGTLASGYTKLAASAKGTALEGANTRLIFSSVAEAARVLGLTTSETEGALLAISQMISKGTVSAEELRGQLGERLPGAFQAAARAMNVTTAELGEMLQRGEVIADDFLPRFANELRATFGAALGDATQTAAANFARFQNAVTDLKQSFSAELLPSLSDTATFIGKELIPAFALLADRMGIITRQPQNLGEALLRRDELREKITRLYADEGNVAGNTRLEAVNRAAVKEALEELAKVNAIINAGTAAKDGSTKASRAQAQAEAQLTKEQNDALRELVPTVKAYQEYEAALRAIASLEVSLAGGAKGVTAGQIAEARLQAEQNLEDALSKAGGADKPKRTRGNSASAAEKLAEKQADEYQRLKDRLDPLSAKTREYLADLQRLDDEFFNGKAGWQEHDQLVAALAEDTDAASAAAKKHQDTVREYQGPFAEYAKWAKDAQRQVEEAFVNGFSAMEDALVKFVRTGKLDFKSLVDGILNDIARLYVRQNITGKLAGALGLGGSGSLGSFGTLGNLFSDSYGLSVFSEQSQMLAAQDAAFGGIGDAFGGIASFFGFHNGGVVGGPPTFTRSLPAAAFAGASRYHGGGIAGLAANERPAILEVGEEVITRRDPRHRYNGGGGITYSPNISIDARGADAAAVEARTMRAIKASQQDTLAQIQALMNKGGAMSKSSGRR
jgi:lambda family phage tail tape measure protein